MSLDQSSSVRDNSDQTKTVTIDLRVFGLTTIKKASYKFTNECAFSFSQISPETLEVKLTFSDHLHREQVVAAFLNEIIDQDLRQLIAAETASTRNLILAHAFSKTSIVNKS